VRLAPEWSEWLVENALRGASREDLVTGLVAGGLPPEEARRYVAEIVSSPVLGGAQRLLARSAGIEQVARLRRALDPGSLDELAPEQLDEQTLYRTYWTAHRPVVLRGGARSWPAASWTPERLAERFGEVEVAALVGRSADRRWWRDRQALTRRMPLRELVALVTSTSGDDVYADGRTDLLDQPGLEALRGELGLLPGLVGDGFPKSWLGPAGTLTPLHHDQSTGWLVQLYGHKRVWLASPLEPALLSTTDGLYNLVDPREPQAGELAEVVWHQVDLAPGDAVLLPVGFWHQVLALTPSISVSMGGFRWTNAFPWYTPGRRV
jgi:ribosomal protein L16 Arg81 hydroxylase